MLRLLRQLAGRRIVVTVGISVLLTTALLWKARPSGPWTMTWTDLHSGPLMLAVVFTVINALLSVARWRTILTSIGVRLPYFECLTIVLAIFPLGLITPFRASDLLRGVAVRRHVPIATGIGSVIVEKLVDVPVLTSIAAIGAFAIGQPGLGVCMLVVVGAVTVSTLWIGKRESLPFRLPHGVGQKVEMLRAALKLFLSDPPLVALTVLFSAAGWLTATLMVYWLLRAADVTMTFPAVMSAWPLAILVGLLPITLAGVGTRDAAFLLFARVPAAQSSQVLTATLLYFVLGYLAVSAVGLAFVPRLLRNDPSFGADASMARAARTR